MKSGEFDKARNYAFLLLKFMPRSEKELFQRLRAKKYSADVVKRVVDFLKEKKFIDDSGFARAWIEYRLKKPFGPRRIKQELLLKGINKEIITRNLAAAMKDYSQDDVVAGIINERMNRLKGLDTQKQRRRIFAYLARRGFSPEIIAEQLDTFGGV